MQSVTQANALVVGGGDAHPDHHATAERCSRNKSFPTTTAATASCSLAEQPRRLGVVAVGSAGSCAAALGRCLREHEVAVEDISESHAHTHRRVRKSNPIDAEMVARAFLAGTARAIATQTDGVVESIRLLRVARQSAVKSQHCAGPSPRSPSSPPCRSFVITSPTARRSAARSLSALSVRRAGSSALRRRPRIPASSGKARDLLTTAATTTKPIGRFTSRRLSSADCASATAPADTSSAGPLEGKSQREIVRCLTTSPAKASTRSARTPPTPSNTPASRRPSSRQPQYRIAHKRA